MANLDSIFKRLQYVTQPYIFRLKAQMNLLPQKLIRQTHSLMKFNFCINGSAYPDQMWSKREKVWNLFKS